MLKEIILLTGLEQQQQALSLLLREHNPQLTFRFALTADDLEAIDPQSLGHARLIAFTTGVIVPPRILNALGHGAYNFHPGPPDYPGWAPAHFALYEHATTFGATAHLMTERVDSGAIIGTETFIIPNNIAVRELEQIAFVRLAYLFWRLAKELANCAEPMPVLPIAWNGRKSTRQMYLSACDIPADISQADLELRVRAFQDDFRGINPTITLHGFQFQLVPATKTATAPTTASQDRNQDQPPAPLALSTDAPSIAVASVM